MLHFVVVISKYPQDVAELEAVSLVVPEEDKIEAAFLRSS